MAVTELVNAMGPAHREEIDLHMAEIEKGSRPWPWS